MTHKKLIILLVVVALAAAGAFAFAEDRGPGMPAGFRAEGPQGPPSEQDLERIEKKVEAVRVWRMTEELRLSEEQVQKFMPLVSSIEQRRKDLFKDQRNAMRELQVYLDARSPDEGKIRAALSQVEKNLDALEGLRKEEIKAVKGNLTAVQQARYVVFQQEFQREIRDMVMKARGGGQQGAPQTMGERPPRPGGPMEGGPEGGPRQMGDGPPRFGGPAGGGPSAPYQPGR